MPSLYNIKKLNMKNLSIVFLFLMIFVATYSNLCHLPIEQQSQIFSGTFEFYLDEIHITSNEFD